jgi:catechol 2,3-dioxygenase-like lactoylglutathione lyase family enzyme
LSKISSKTYQAPKSILETVLYCDDLVAAGEFYEEVVGLTLFSHEPNRHRFYQVGGGMLLIFRPETTEQDTVQIGECTIPLHGAHGPGHIAFAVGEEEMDPVRRRLAEFDIPIESEIDWPSGGHSIYCRDPGQNCIEFATRSLWFRSL